ncbi:hypothetical protein K1719_025749 [Acacia pycnantha]|nr:hypothetical protein K1719_025749 [Acacia pycnantha]
MASLLFGCSSISSIHNNDDDLVREVPVDEVSNFISLIFIADFVTIRTMKNVHNATGNVHELSFTSSTTKWKCALRDVRKLYAARVLATDEELHKYTYYLKFLGFKWYPLSWIIETAAIMLITLSNGGVGLQHLLDC